MPFAVQHRQSDYSLAQAVSDTRTRTNRMKHDAKLMQKRGKDMSKLIAVLSQLAYRDRIPRRLI